MSDLVVIAYPDPNKAAEVRDTLLRLQKEHLIDLEDAVYFIRDANGKTKLHQAIDLTAAGAVSGGFWGALIGTLFLMPLAGAAVGAAAGALTGVLTDIGVDDDFAKQVAAGLPNNSSALFILFRKVTADKVLPEIARYGGRIIQTSLSNDAEAQIKTALEAGGMASTPAAAAPISGTMMPAAGTPTEVPTPAT